MWSRDPARPITAHLAAELVHGLQELLQRHAPAPVLVKQTEGSLHEVFLTMTKYVCLSNISFYFYKIFSHIFGGHNLLELLEVELSLAIAHVVPEDGLQPLDALLGDRPVWAAAGLVVVPQIGLSVKLYKHGEGPY